jgi:amino-acid N-acetyltransferase
MRGGVVARRMLAATALVCAADFFFASAANRKPFGRDKCGLPDSIGDEKSMSLLIRPAMAEDQPHIISLARGERIKPIGLHWPKFMIAEEDGRIIGAVQLRNHPDGSLELGSLVVAAPFRGRGVATRLIDRRLAEATGRVFLITGEVHGDYYRRWGFRRIQPNTAPLFVRLNYWMGYLGGGLLAKLRGRAVNHLALFER